MVQSIGSGVVGHWIRKGRDKTRFNLWERIVWLCLLVTPTLTHASRVTRLSPSFCLILMRFQGHDRTLGPQPREGPFTRSESNEGHD